MTQFRITYSVMDADMSALHEGFESALQAARALTPVRLTSWIDHQPVATGRVHAQTGPANTAEVISETEQAGPTELNRAMAGARRAFPDWAATPVADRAAVVKRAADLISARRMHLAAAMALEVGKNRLECLGDVEEAADLLRYYADQILNAGGWEHPLTRLTPNEDTRSVLRPYGVFGVISPFNFPSALPAGMSGAAILAGNTVVLKPADKAPWSAHLMVEALRDAGLPAGVLQLLQGDGPGLGEALARHPELDGIAFTGSTDVGMGLFRILTEGRVRPCLLEMGGKNACIIDQDAHLDDAIEGCTKSAFGLSGQKCSALSRLYVHRSHWQTVVDALVARAEAVRIGPPDHRDHWMGPVIDAAARRRHHDASEEAHALGALRTGGVCEDAGLPPGHWVAPTVTTLPVGHPLHHRELFLPFVDMQPMDDLADGLRRANAAPYGLTAGYYGASEEGVQRFLEGIEAGCVYVNRRAGATTGAWPGVQAFCGWKASGSTGKGGCGPWYVSQFLREQSRTRVFSA
jgi:1-pyrroline-5-carboxylate dehydrogenase